jgi:hypothetical protein
VVIDLSHRRQDEKIEYIRALLPALNELRTRTGLPHRIVVDEAHYFLQDAGARHLLDLEHNGYTVVTYWASRLPRELLARTEVMVVTCESSAAEIEALRQWCSTCDTVDRSRWSMLGHLRIGQAVALPITEEASGDLRFFTIAPRLTPHVRHREKYVDVPVPDPRAFVFTRSGQVSGQRVKTLRQFVSVLEQTPTALFEPYLQRGDFSRWIADVFGDHALAGQLRTLEARSRDQAAAETIPEIVAAIRGRYDLVDEEVPAA